jgi:hypothetical protein
MSKQKSFYMRAPTMELKDTWVQAIKDAARYFWAPHLYLCCLTVQTRLLQIPQRT